MYVLMDSEVHLLLQLCALEYTYILPVCYKHHIIREIKIIISGCSLKRRRVHHDTTVVNVNRDTKTLA